MRRNLRCQISSYLIVSRTMLQPLLAIFEIDRLYLQATVIVFVKLFYSPGHEPLFSNA
jgi:hypothetical protein